MSVTLAGPLLLVGAGKMGGALLGGWLRQGLDPALVYVQDPTPAPEVAALMASHGIRVRHQAKLPAPPSVMVIAVKPQIIDGVLPALGSSVGPSTVVLSIAAGRTLANLKMPGQWGNERVTVQNLVVAKVLEEQQVVLIEGSVPGSRNAIVTVRGAVKARKKAAAA